MKFDRNGDRLVIISGVRTPIGQAGKSLAKKYTYEYGTDVLIEAINRSGIEKSQIDGVVAGEIMQSSKAPNVARVMSVKADLKQEITAVTVANNCVSGVEAITEASRRVLLGENEVVAVVGQEGMSKSIIYLGDIQRNSKASNVQKIKDNWNELPELEEFEVIDSMEEGLTDPVRNAIMMETAEVVSQKLGLKRKELDNYAHSSYQRAYDAIEKGKYDPFIMPVEHEKGILEKDEYIMSKKGFVDKPERFAKSNALYDWAPHTNMKDFYKKFEKYIGRSYSSDVEGTVTLFNSCPRSDGAGSVIVTTESKAKELGAKPLAYIVGWGNKGVDPVVMGLGIAYSMEKALINTGLKWADINSYEIHEAFAATALGSMKVVKNDMGFDLVSAYEKKIVNPAGGTLALGHPTGMTGVRAVLNQIMEFQNNSNVRYSISGVCAGGGVGGSIILERAS